MAVSEEFKQAIKEGRLNDAFILAMSQAPELNITTWIAAAENSTAQPQTGQCLQTKINLVEGAITNQIGEELIGDRLYQKAQQFHLQQISQGHQTISHNLESIQQILRLMTILQLQKQGKSYQSIAPFKISTQSLPKAETTSENATKTVTFPAEPHLAQTQSNAVIDTTEIAKEPDEVVTNAKDEDWGEWLEETEAESNLDLDADILTLDAFDLDEAEEWGDETEFLPDATVKPVEQDETDSPER
ncbi:MAG TPA: hypothetical protein ACFCUY_14505 [Xenococcaceae cyanobacterium]